MSRRELVKICGWLKGASKWRTAEIISDEMDERDGMGWDGMGWGERLVVLVDL